jgi:hypothetical protein
MPVPWDGSFPEYLIAVAISCAKVFAQAREQNLLGDAPTLDILVEPAVVNRRFGCDPNKISDWRGVIEQNNHVDK